MTAAKSQTANLDAAIGAANLPALLDRMMTGSLDDSFADQYGRLL